MPGRYCGGWSARLLLRKMAIKIERKWLGGMVTYAEDGQQDVEQQLGAAADLEEDAERREDDGEDDLADVAAKG